MNKKTLYFIHIRAYIIYGIIYEKNIIFYKKQAYIYNKHLSFAYIHEHIYTQRTYIHTIIYSHIYI